MSKSKQNISKQNIINPDVNIYRYKNVNNNRTVSISKYEFKKVDNHGNKIYDKKLQILNISDFIDILNSIPSSKNALEICNSLNINDICIKNYALQYSITYKEIFKNNKKYIDDNIIKLLGIIGFDNQISINNNIFKNIIYIKTKIYEFKQKCDFNYESSEWIGMLAGIILYFDEIDERNHNCTSFLQDVKKPFTVNIFTIF